MITVRPYEATLADQIIFVDEITDENNEILNQIYNDKSDFATICKNLLRVNPSNICDNHNEVISNNELVSYILSQQHIWYDNLKNEIINRDKSNI